MRCAVGSENLSVSRAMHSTTSVTRSLRLSGPLERARAAISLASRGVAASIRRIAGALAGNLTKQAKSSARTGVWVSLDYGLDATGVAVSV